eukprot:504354_1
MFSEPNMSPPSECGSGGSEIPGTGSPEIPVGTAGHSPNPGFMPGGARSGWNHMLNGCSGVGESECGWNDVAIDVDMATCVSMSQCMDTPNGTGLLPNPGDCMDMPPGDHDWSDMAWNREGTGLENGWSIELQGVFGGGSDCNGGSIDS